MATLAKLDILLGMHTEQFFRDMKRVQRKMRAVGRELQGMGKGLTYGLTVPMGMAAIQSTKMATTFDESMTKIVSLVGVSREQVDQWGKDLLELAPKVGKAPQDLANGLFFVTSAGFKTAEAMDILEKSAMASAVGLGDTATAADLITSAMNAYKQSNMSAERAASTLIATVREGKAYAEDLAPVMGRLVPIGAELGISFEELGASMAGLTRVGLPAAEASTSIRTIMTALIKPTSKSAKALSDVGLNLGQLRQEVDEKGLLPALLGLREKLQGIEPTGQMFSRIRALTGVLALTGENAKDAMEIFERMKDNTGDLAEAFEETASRPMLMFQMALAAIQAAGVKLGYVVMPYVLKAVQKVSEVISKATTAFEELDPKIKKTVLTIGLIAVAAGPVIFALGTLITIIGSIGPASIAAAAGIAAIVVGVGVYWQQIKKAVVDFWEYAKPVFVFMYEHFAAQIQKIKDTAIRIWPDIKEIFEKLKTFFGQYGKEIKAVLTVTLVLITDVAAAMVTALTGSIEIIVKALNGDFKGAWEAAKRMAIGINDDIATSQKNLAQIVGYYAWKGAELVMKAWEAISQTIVDVMVGIYNNPLMIGPMKKYFGDYVEYLQGQQDEFGKYARDAKQEADRIMQGFGESIKTQLPEVAKQAKKIVYVTAEAVLDCTKLPAENPMIFMEWSDKSAKNAKSAFGTVTETVKEEIKGLQKHADENPIVLGFRLVGPDGKILDPTDAAGVLP